MGKLDNKVAIITGSTSGLGKQTACLFAQEGAKTVIVGRRSDRGNEVVKTILDNGGDAIFIQADMQDMASVDKIVDGTVKAYRKINVLVSNAGIVYNMPFTDNTMADYDSVMNVNLKFPFFLTQKAIPYLLETGGNVIYTASGAGHRPTKNAQLYNISKSALIMLTQSLGVEYADKGVRFNSISPGFFDTDILNDLQGAVKDAYVNGLPMKRMGAANEFAKVALFLASDDASYVTGADLLVDGALNLKL
ncbi:MAG: SDR family oxidoreductase [Oscillospiraceae bacterium]|nr:SDR family oxidoreductase [Oscillospiraceae bacterium]